MDSVLQLLMETQAGIEVQQVQGTGTNQPRGVASNIGDMTEEGEENPPRRQQLATTNSEAAS